MFKAITHRPFIVNLLVAALIIVVLIFAFLQLLGVITRHGEYLTVPSVLGKPTAEAVKLLESKGFEVAIQDSIYTDTARMGIVLKQLPDANSTVKVNRTVQLTVNRVTLPLVEMPALEGKTINFALTILQRSHLTLGDTIYEPHFMRGSVLAQSFGGKPIASGSKIPWGSSIDLTIGKGLSEERIIVPMLDGLTLAEAKIILEQSGIILGAMIVDPDVTDTLAGFVYDQRPPRYDEFRAPLYIQAGQIMDIKISKEIKKAGDSTSITLPND